VDEFLELRRKNYRQLLISHGLVGFFFGMQAQSLPLYVLELGGNASHVGMIAGLGPFMALFFRPLTGYFLDTRGRKIVLLAGIWIYIIVTMGYVFAPSIVFLFILRGMAGMALSATTSTVGAAASDLRPDDLTRSLYTIGIIQIVSSVSAPMISIFIATHIGFRLMYVINSMGFAAALFTAHKINYEKVLPKAKRANTSKAHGERGISKILETSALIPSCCMIFHGLANSSMMSFAGSYGKTIGIGNIGFFFLINGAVTLLIRPILWKYAAPSYRNRVFAVGVSAFVIAIVLFIFSSSWIWLAVASIPYSIAFSTIPPIINSIALSAAPAHRKGTANSTYYMFWDFGFGGGSIMLGSVASGYGYTSIFLIGIASALVLGFIYWRFLSLKKK